MSGSRPARKSPPGISRITPSISERAAAARPVDKAYSGIRRAILAGTLQPGEHLREETLAAMTGTSRTPVREALGRLVGEGLATLVNRHRYVADFSFDEVAIVFDVRARLEAYVAQVAAQRITGDEIAELEAIADAIDGVIARSGSTGIDRFRPLNFQFHTTIIRAARSTQLKALLAPTVALPLESIKQQLWEQPVRMARSNEQHREVIAALASGDAQWAAAAMSNHILSTKPVRLRAPPHAAAAAE